MIAPQSDEDEIEGSVVRGANHIGGRARLRPIDHVASQEAGSRHGLGSVAVREHRHRVAGSPKLRSIDGADNAGANDQDLHRLCPWPPLSGAGGRPAPVFGKTVMVPRGVMVATPGSAAACSRSRDLRRRYDDHRAIGVLDQSVGDAPKPERLDRGEEGSASVSCSC